MGAALAAALGISAVICACSSKPPEVVRPIDTALARVLSPDGKIEGVLEQSNEALLLTLKVDGNTVLDKCKIALDTSLGKIGSKIDLSSPKISVSDARGEISVPLGIRSKSPDNYNSVSVDFGAGAYEIVMRAYNDALAYRFISKLGNGNMKVLKETLELPVPESLDLIAHIERGLKSSSFECPHTRITPKGMKKVKNASLPILMRFPDGKTVAVLESDVSDYPGMRIAAGDDENYPLKAIFAKYPKKFVNKKVYIPKVVEVNDWLVDTKANREFPWRAFVVSRDDSELAGNDTVYKLARPSQGDYSWVKGGMCSWEWWNAFGLKNTPFKPGLNIETYKRYVDFASKNGIPYVLVDAGWLTGADVGEMKEGVHEAIFGDKGLAFDVKALVDYAHSKNVKIVLWLLSQTADMYPGQTFALVKKLGADGVKIDFCDRDDAAAMNFYEKTAKLAAENKLILDFHGCAKPSGLQRTYPNLINFEGVLGNEYNKWSKKVTPSHNVDLIFTRMLCGPMDYTPGGMKNSFSKDFKAVRTDPEVMGTRCHEMSKFVLYYGPLQMMCDSPDAYEACPEVLKFISSCPTSWDETVPLEGKIGEYASIARKSGDTWYVGGMNGTESARGFKVDSSKFLPPDGTYSAELFRDSEKPGAKATDYVREVFDVKSGDILDVKTIGEGGFVLKLSPKK